MATAQHKPFKTYPLLRPLAWVYRQVMRQHNSRFDDGRLKTEAFGLPVISVGNISVGGTGKTPMCAYLVELLCNTGHSPALLSRGYGRTTKGFRKVTSAATAATVGDEPLELYKRHRGTVAVYVCEDRCEGARRIIAENNGTDVLVLDDAYQHRYIDRDLNIMLTDCNRLYTRDKVMPEGRLREDPSGAKRADVVIVTKCRPDMTEGQATAIRNELGLQPCQQLFFTTIKYAAPTSPYPDIRTEESATSLKNAKVLVFTGIANPTSLTGHYSHRCASVKTLAFGDHHAFSSNDIRHIAEAATDADIVITTAKDFQRLPLDLPQSLKQKLLVQHIFVGFLFDQQEQFNDIVRLTIDKYKTEP